jgi:adenylate cyclase
VIVGNVGGRNVLDYRPLGDAINTAARLESVNRHLGTRLCVSGDTARLCPDFVGRPVGTLVLKGKTQGVAAFEPAPPAAAESPRFARYLEAFGLLERDDPAATGAFAGLAAEAPEDGLVAFHLERLRQGERGSVIVLSEK